MRAGSAAHDWCVPVAVVVDRAGDHDVAAVGALQQTRHRAVIEGDVVPHERPRAVDGRSHAVKVSTQGYPQPGSTFGGPGRRRKGTTQRSPGHTYYPRGSLRPASRPRSFSPHRGRVADGRPDPGAQPVGRECATHRRAAGSDAPSTVRPPQVRTPGRLQSAGIRYSCAPPAPGLTPPWLTMPGRGRPGLTTPNPATARHARPGPALPDLALPCPARTDLTEPCRGTP